MGLDRVIAGVPPITNSLSADTASALAAAQAQVGQADANAARIQNIIESNINRQISATDWTSGLKTSGELLRAGVSLAKA